MGWWGIERDGRELEIGDRPLDAVNSALKQIIRAYAGAFKRKPTPEELTQLLESSIRALETELFDDMDERELESVTVRLRQRPKRPKPEPGDYFAIPLPSGGYGYGRVMKVKLRVLLWMRLLDVRSSDQLSMDELLAKGRTILDLETGMHKIDSTEWPIIGHLPLSDAEQEALMNEPHWITNHASWGVEAIAEWKLAKKRGLPPNVGVPYEGYSGF